MKKNKMMMMIVVLVVVVLAIMCYYMCKKEGYGNTQSSWITHPRGLTGDNIGTQYKASVVCRKNSLGKDKQGCIACSKTTGMSDHDANILCTKPVQKPFRIVLGDKSYSATRAQFDASAGCRSKWLGIDHDECVKCSVSAGMPEVHAYNYCTPMDPVDPHRIPWTPGGSSRHL